MQDFVHQPYYPKKCQVYPLSDSVGYRGLRFRVWGLGFEVYGTGVWGIGV